MSKVARPRMENRLTFPRFFTIPSSRGCPPTREMEIHVILEQDGQIAFESAASHKSPSRANPRRKNIEERRTVLVKRTSGDLFLYFTFPNPWLSELVVEGGFLPRVFSRDHSCTQRLKRHFSRFSEIVGQQCNLWKYSCDNFSRERMRIIHNLHCEWLCIM